MTWDELNNLNTYQLRQVATGAFVGTTSGDRAAAQVILTRRERHLHPTHGDCCTHPRWRHRLAAASTKWRFALVGWLITKGIVLAYLLHPVVHMVLRALGIGCP